MAGSIDLNKVMDDAKEWFKKTTEQVKAMFVKKPTGAQTQARPKSQGRPYDMNDLMSDVKAWFQDLPNKINNIPNTINDLVEKVKNYPPDKQAAVGSIVTGSFLVLIALILFMI